MGLVMRVVQISALQIAVNLQGCKLENSEQKQDLELLPSTPDSPQTVEKSSNLGTEIMF